MNSWTKTACSVLAVAAGPSVILSDVVLNRMSVFIKREVCLTLIVLPSVTKPVLEICGSDLSLNFGHSAAFLILLSTSQVQKSCLEGWVGIEKVEVPSNVESAAFSSYCAEKPLGFWSRYLHRPMPSKCWANNFFWAQSETNSKAVQYILF